MGPAKRKRVITNKRREQNRGAQKIYRAKIKAKLEQLEGLQHGTSASSTTPVDDKDATAGRDNDTSAKEVDELATNEDVEAVAETSHDACLQLRNAIQGFVVRPYLSDPRLNHLQLPHISLISAGLENSLSLNITKDDALTLGFASPFNHSAGLAPNSNIPAWWSSIPRDLYPTCLQLSIPHQAWLDSIPIPSFRDNALSYLAAGRAQDQDFNLGELADDIDSGGLICWGGMGNGSHGTGTPWDARSWEARPWFLNKWKYVTGGFKGELGTMSTWWWRLKGEDIQLRRLDLS